MKKITTVSLFAMCVACPAFAEPSHTADTFPSNGLMQEDYTYTGQATQTNMLVYEGSVDANAEYEWDIITVNPGYYIPQSSTTASQCTAGNFCPGITTDNQARTPHYDSSAAQGITSCATVGDNSFTQSAAGASANTDCYRACTVANANIAHATAVSGNDYYGAGVDTCAATACENGWHVDNGMPDFATITAGGGTSFGYEYYWRVGAIYGDNFAVAGIHSCNSQEGTTNNNTWSDPSSLSASLPNTGGRHCWCKMRGYTYTPNDEYGTSLVPLESSWAYSGMSSDGDGAVYCEELDCDLMCSGLFANNSAFRTAIFGSLPTSLATCAANTITINWSDASAADIAANEAGTVTYGGDIRTPVAATPVTGKTFKGWRFSVPEQE